MVISSKFLLLVFALAASSAGVIVYLADFDLNFTAVALKTRESSKQSVKESLSESNESSPIELPVAPNQNYQNQNVEPASVTTPLPKEVLLNVPFATQSPYSIWDARDEESCEEASIVMVHYFRQNKNLTPALMRKELDLLINFEIKTFGNYIDSNAQNIAQIAEVYYKYKNVKVQYNIKIEDLKRELASGNPVIVPTAGRLLGNPNYKPPGPLYHTLVLVGYNSKGFISNDSGTRKGKSYFYSYNVLYNAIHDFPGSKAKILEGKKAMVIIK